MKSYAAVVAVSLMAGCSGSGGDSSPGSGVAAPCGDLDTVMVDGTLDAAPVSATGALSTFAWMNIGTPSKFDGGWTGGSMHLEWAGSVASGHVTSVSAAALTLTSSSSPRTFQSGTLVYDSPHGSTESTLRTSLTFDTGTVTVCVRKKG